MIIEDRGARTITNVYWIIQKIEYEWKIIDKNKPPVLLVKSKNNFTAFIGSFEEAQDYFDKQNFPENTDLLYHSINEVKTIEYLKENNKFWYPTLEEWETSLKNVRVTTKPRIVLSRC
jgi:hypothetical protein